MLVFCKRLSFFFYFIGSLFAYQPGASLAGSLILSSNVSIVWSNSSGTSYNTNLSVMTNSVAVIQGFTNYGALNSGVTNQGSGGQTLVYPFLFTNWANSNSIFQFSVSSNIGWAVDITNMPSTYLTNLAPFSGFTAYMRIQVSSSATNNSIGVFTLSNSLAPSLTNRHALYLGSNSFGYGGAKSFADSVTVKVGGPIILANKTVFVTNTAGGNIPWNEAIPGSQLTYAISYSNAGTSAAYGVTFLEAWDKSLAQWVTNSATSGAGTNVSYATNGTWSYSPLANAGVVDTNVDGVRFTLANVPVGGSGVLSYKLIIR